MRGAEVRLDALGVTYPGGFTAVHPTDLAVAAGEFFSILGPSGCGKTTVLRTVSGFIAPTAGSVLIDGEYMAGRPPDRRPTALIFQSLALSPLMSVEDNVAFGLEARGVPRRVRRERAGALLDLVALADQAGKTPAELSGGQRQRVAIARALAVEPAVLLLDEPLSALDLKLRQRMRAELRRIQRETGVTFVYITHDQGEALAMSDRIAVMNEGRIEQVGPPAEVYADPATAFVAGFVGEANRLPGRIAAPSGGQAIIETAAGRFTARNPQGLPEGTRATLFVRPEAVTLAPGGAAANRLQATLERRDLEGAFVTDVFRSPAGMEVVMQAANLGTPPPSGEVEIGFDPGRAVLLPDSPREAAE